ncbi:MAG: hypothetical protein KJ621_09500 [Proteobacteria bacterium]|nr:hypothetical protein [Pseudomonadota bacterium]MBU1742506.1 hypothetical protein [Pseudomonadota bacterium]
MSQAYKNSDRLEYWASLLSIMARAARMVENMAEVLEDVWPFSGSATGSNLMDWPDLSGWFPDQAWGAPWWGTLPWWGATAPAKRCQELEEKCAAQQKEIAELRRALAEKDPDLAQTQRRVQEILETQGRQFEQLMDSLTDYFATEQARSDQAVPVGSDSESDIPPQPNPSRGKIDHG